MLIKSSTSPVPISSLDLAGSKGVQSALEFVSFAYGCVALRSSACAYPYMPLVLRSGLDLRPNLWYSLPFEASNAVSYDTKLLLERQRL